MNELQIKEITNGLSAIHSTIKEPLTFSLFGKEFVLLPGVFRPDITEATLFQIENTKAVSTDVALELGCGSGIQSIFLAKKVTRVVATDINPEAVKNTQLNMVKHNLENIDVRQGNLFDPLDNDEVFNLIIFNPPFFTGKATSFLERSWFQTDKLWPTFFEKVRRHLDINAKIEICYSSFGNLNQFLESAYKEGFRHSVIAEKDILVLNKYNEKLLLVRFTP